MQRSMARSFRSWTIPIIWIAIAGCYQSQNVLTTRDGGGSGPPDSGPAWNGGPPPTVDAALPPIDEPEVGPDERPSDDPGAGAWMDPPVSSNPCCEMGELVGLGDPTHQAFPPLVAWGGDAWGVVWAEQGAPADDPSEPDHVIFAQLGADARPIGAPTSVWGLGVPEALAYASDRYAIGARRPGRAAMNSYLGLLGPTGALVDFVPVDEFVDAVARYPVAHAWVALTGSGPMSLRRYDDALDPVGAPIDVGEGFAIYSGLVALKSRLVAVVPTLDGVMHATFGGSELVPVSNGLLVRPGTYTNASGFEELGLATAATAMRDTVVAVVMDGTDLWSVVYDPFFDAIVNGPTRVVRTPALDGLDVAGDPEGGTVGVCYVDGDGPYGGYRDGTPQESTRIRFVLLGPDGTQLGTPVTIADTEGLRPLSCAVAAAGRDAYVVAFWDRWTFVDHFPIFARRVDVRR